MAPRIPRLAVRAVILHQDRLLLVNAWPGQISDLWCAPGGGVECGSSLPDNLAREVAEETGLKVTVAEPLLINEFHDPQHGFHQVEIFFRCTVTDSRIPAGWADPEGVVNRHRWVTQAEFATLSVKPDSLATLAWAVDAALRYDPLELVLR